MNLLTLTQQGFQGAWAFVGRAVNTPTQTFALQNQPHPLAALYSSDENIVSIAQENFKKHCPSIARLLETCDSENSSLTKVESTKEKISVFLHNIIFWLEPEQRNAIYGSVYQMAQVTTDDPNWGSNHAMDDIPRLIKAMEAHLSLEGNSSHLVHIWTNENHLHNGSRKFTLEGRQEQYERRIGYVNGINTPFDQAKWDAIRFSDELTNGRDMHCIWNAPHGGMEDYIVTAKMMFFDALPEPSRLLINDWLHFFDINKTNDVHFLQICFSQSSLIVKNAMNVLPLHLQSRMSIIAIGPACFIKSVPGSEIRHFVKIEDIVPTMFASGRSRLSNPNDPEIVIVPHDDNSNPHDPHGSRYTQAIRPYVDKYFQTGKML